MPSIIYLRKTGGAFIPHTLEDKELADKLPVNQPLKCVITRQRNPGFHRKFFKLLEIGYDAWEPQAEHKGMVIQKNFETYRKDMLILSGFYTVDYSLNGSGFKLIPKSMSFANMSQDEFEKVYNAVFNVILRNLPSTYTEEELQNTVAQLMEIDG